MGNGEMVVSEQAVWAMQPRNLDEAMKYAEIIAKSDLVPNDYKGKPGNVLIAIQMGQEVGLKPLQALQGIAVINGRPSIWGDAVLGLVRGSGLVEDFREDFDPQTFTATCSIKRKGQPTPIIRTFGKQEAERANLWKKAGTWTNYPQRMVQLRARAFALRDGFADVLKGLSIAEEQADVVEGQATSLAAPEKIEAPKRLSETSKSSDHADGETGQHPQAIPDADSYVKHEAKTEGMCGECQGNIPSGETYYFDKSTNRVRCAACYEVETSPR